MSHYKVGDKDDWGNDYIKQQGHVEMWHNPKKGSYMVYLYEHIGMDEGFVMYSTKQKRENADWVFDKVVDMLG